MTFRAQNRRNEPGNHFLLCLLLSVLLAAAVLVVVAPLCRDGTRYSPDDSEPSDVLSVDNRRISSSSVASRGRLLVLALLSVRESCGCCWAWSSSTSNGEYSSSCLGRGGVGSSS